MILLAQYCTYEESKLVVMLWVPNVVKDAWRSLKWCESKWARYHRVSSSPDLLPTAHCFRTTRSSSHSLLLRKEGRWCRILGGFTFIVRILCWMHCVCSSIETFVVMAGVLEKIEEKLHDVFVGDKDEKKDKKGEHKSEDKEDKVKEEKKEKGEKEEKKKDKKKDKDEDEGEEKKDKKKKDKKKKDEDSEGEEEKGKEKKEKKDKKKKDEDSEDEGKEKKDKKKGKDDDDEGEKKKEKKEKKDKKDKKDKDEDD